MQPTGLLTRRQAMALPLGLAAPPLAFASGETAVDETWLDARRQREVPVRVRWPSATRAVPGGGHPVVLFSHGLGGSRSGGSVWGEAWASAGFVVVHLQHHGSDLEAVRVPGGLRAAMQPQQLLARLDDIRFVLDEIGRRHREGARPRWPDVRPDAIGMSGHSFGAHTTLGMAGQAYPGMAPLQETRLSAFAAFSPAVPTTGNARQAYAAMTRPMLCLTGTLDGDVVGNGSTPEQRRAVFDALPAGHKAQLLLKDADHMSFAGQEEGPSTPVWRALRQAPAAAALLAQHHTLIASVTTDWWRAHLMNDPAAQSRLARPQGLAPGDHWQQA
jgi:dienelactone hydrolase